MPSGTPLVIELEGEFDIYAQADLKRLLAPARTAPSVIVDFTRVRYIDSSALAVIVSVHRDRTKAALSKPALVGASAQIRRLLSLTQVDRLWQVVETIEEAHAL